MPFPQQYLCFGITKMPLRLICEEAAETESVETACEEPLIVRYMQRHFYLQGQWELFWTLKTRKVNAYPVFILITDKEEYQTFMQGYGKYFQQVRI